MMRKIKTTWQSLRITQKIWGVLSILIIGYLASMTFGFILGRHIEARMANVAAALFPAAIQSQQALSAFNDQNVRYSEAVIIGDPKLLETAQQLGLEVERALEAVVSLTGLPQDKRDAVQETLQQFRTFVTSAQTIYTTMSETPDDENAIDKIADMKQQTDELAHQTEELRQSLETFKTLFGEMLKTEVSTIQARSRQNRYQNVAVFVIVVTLATVLVNFLITRGITRPIAAIVDIAEAIASGDVSQEVQITSYDEIGALADAFRHMKTTIRAVLQETERLVQAVQAGQLTVRGQAEPFSGRWRDLVQGVNGVFDAFTSPVDTTARAIDQIANGEIPEPLPEIYQGEFNLITQKINTMSAKLKEVVSHVKTVAHTVAVTSSEIHHTAEQMAEGASQQATSTEEVSASMEQMAANIHQNADNARQTEQIAVQSTQYAEQSGAVVAEAVQAMQQIAKKIMVIQDIADQTRMLSLNATIEAARAQEHGKAFSVVASEVRKLSDVTKTAAEEINELASSSLDISEKAGTMLATLVPNIQKTAGLVQEISAASREQSTGTAMVNEAIQQLDNITQHHVIIAEQMTSTAEELSLQANQLQQAIAFFHVVLRHEGDDNTRNPSSSDAPSGNVVQDLPVNQKKQPQKQRRMMPTRPPATWNPQMGVPDTRAGEFERY